MYFIIYYNILYIVKNLKEKFKKISITLVYTFNLLLNLYIYIELYLYKMLINI